MLVVTAWCVGLGSFSVAGRPAVSFFLNQCAVCAVSRPYHLPFACPSAAAFSTTSYKLLTNYCIAALISCLTAVIVAGRPVDLSLIACQRGKKERTPYYGATLYRSHCCALSRHKSRARRFALLMDTGFGRRSLDCSDAIEGNQRGRTR